MRSPTIGRPCVLALVAAVSASACAHRVPRRADIELVSVSVAPTKPDGRPWDDVRLADMMLAMAQPAAVTIAGVEPLGVGIAIAADALRKELAAASLPDPVGTATLTSDDGETVAVIPKQANTCEPRLLAEWRDVRLTRSTRIALRLRDADVIGSDDLGTVELTWDDLARAARARGVETIPVEDRDARLRAVGLRVRSAAR